MDNLTETKLTSEKIYSGCILDFYRDTVRLPNGGTAPRELSRHVGAVCIVPLLDDGRVIVERQFRYPVNEVITEIPAGKRDSRSEAPEAAARRELREETGITASSSSTTMNFSTCRPCRSRSLRATCWPGASRTRKRRRPSCACTAWSTAMNPNKTAARGGHLTAACRLSHGAILSAGGTGPFSHTGRRRSS